MEIIQERSQKIEYITHKNFGRPFKVRVKERNDGLYKIHVFGVTIIDNEDEDKEDYQYYPHKKVIADKLFIGKSPLTDMTERSECYGDNFDGNSLLFRELGKEIYTYVGDGMYSFRTLSDIKTYVSPMGPNDVPYPYAIDNDGNYYLMIEGVVIRNTENTRSRFSGYEDKHGHSDPYSYYYDYHYITATRHHVPHPPKIERFMNIERFWKEDEHHAIYYNPSGNGRFGKKEGRLFIKYYDNEERVQITKEDLSNIINEYGKMMNFEKLESVGEVYYPNC